MIGHRLNISMRVKEFQVLIKEWNFGVING